MLKKNTPGPRVALTHGRKPGAHWSRVGGRLVIDLDEMWDDFEFGVNRLVESLRIDPARRRVVLDRFSKQEWTVLNLPLVVEGAQSVSANSLSAVPASYSQSHVTFDLGNAQETGGGGGRPKTAGSRKRKPRKKRRRR